MNKMSPTPRQKECLDFIAQYVGENGYAPAYREIADHLGQNLSSVHRLIQGLKDRGHIDTMPGRARAIMLVGEKANE